MPHASVTHKPFSWLTNQVLNLLLPARCVSCGVHINHQDGLCADCWSDVRFITEPSCAKCDHPFSYDMGEGAICAGCMADEPRYDRAMSAMVYDDASRRLVTRYKYADRTQTTDLYARWMVRRGEKMIAEADVICPVPLHRWRMLTRRYNQSALLAKAIGKLTNKPVKQQLLARIKHTAPQASLARSARLGNVKGCFAVKNPGQVLGLNVLLVDDVTTTGATIDECVRMLKKAGAKQVFVLTLAKAVDDAAL